VNYELVDPYAKSLAKDKVPGVWVNGTSGESMSLTTEERMKLLEHWHSAAQKYGLSVIAHIGCQSVEDSRQLAAHAEKLGVAAVAAMAPCFFKPNTVDELVEFLAQVAAAAPRTPFFYYYYPGITGVSFRMSDVFEKGKSRIPTLAGAKFTGNDLGDVIYGLSLGDYTVFLGNETMILPGAAAGAQGSVGIAYSSFGPLFQEIVEAFEAGDLAKARSLQIKCVKLHEECKKYPLIPAYKSVLKMTKGWDLGPCRAPQRSLDAGETAALESALKSFGVI